MKLASFHLDDQIRIGAVVDDGQRIVDLRRALARALAAEGDLQAHAHASALIPGDMTAFLEGGSMSLSHAERALAWATSDNGGQEVTYALGDVELRAPVPNPPKVFGIGGNYPELSDTWPEPPEIPPVFQRARTSITGPGSEVIIPAKVTYLQPEMELCVVIGERCNRVSAEGAYDVVAGYMIGNDLSDIDVLMSQWVERQRPDLEEHGLPTEAPYNLGLAFQSKSWDTTGPTGPYLVTPDEVDPDSLEFEFRINGERVGGGNTSEMLIKIPRIIEYLSSIATLEPGDIIFTGARGESALTPVKDGDVMEHIIAGLGSFSSRCVAE